MKPQWNVRRAMLIGALLAGVYLAGRIMMASGFASGGELLTYQLIEIASGALFGAAIGWVVARVRNRWAR